MDTHDFHVGHTELECINSMKAQVMSFCSLLDSQCPAQCLLHSRHTINICESLYMHTI